MNTSQLKVLGLFLGHADGKLIKAAAFGEIMKPNVIASTTNCLLQGTQLPNIGIVVGFFSCNEWFIALPKVVETIPLFHTHSLVLLTCALLFLNVSLHPRFLGSIDVSFSLHISIILACSALHFATKTQGSGTNEQSLSLNCVCLLLET